MEFGNDIYFSKKYKLNQVNIENRGLFIEQIIDRIKTFYLEPIEILIEKKEGFASLLLIFSTIEIVAYILFGKAHLITKILPEILIKDGVEFELKRLEIIKVNFRDGLTHEGIIKFQSFCSFRIKKSVEFYEEKKFAVNPSILFNNLLDFVNDDFENKLKSKNGEILNKRNFKIF
jgi:hypothetical protein